MKLRRHVLGVAVAAGLAFGLTAVPAHATVHEIVAQWCSGQEELGPPGISKAGSKNFAKPLNAAGVVITIVDPIAQTVFITFDYNHPAIKVRSTGLRVPIGTTPEGFTVLLDVIEPDPDFPAFQHCPALGF
jgi:hypothetical protein